MGWLEREFRTDNTQTTEPEMPIVSREAAKTRSFKTNRDRSVAAMEAGRILCPLHKH